MKESLVKVVAAVVALYFRHFPIQIGKSLVWKTVVLRRLYWRHLTLSANVLGARFNVCLPDMIQSYLYFFGKWEPVITRYVLDRLGTGDVFIDVGANIGYYTLIASRRVGPNGRVFAIEAASSIFEKLQQNLAQNAVHNVTAFNVAVSDKPGQVPVWLNRGSNLGGTRRFPMLRSGALPEWSKASKPSSFTRS